MVRKFRPFWIFIHKWIGLILGLWIVLNGLSGSALVFQHEIEAALDPELYRTDRPIIGEIDLDGMANAVTTAFPGYWIVLAERDNLVANESFRFQLAKDGESYSYFTSLEVFVDPVTAEIMGSRPWFTVMKAVKMFHFELLSGRTGEIAMGLMALAFLVMILVGPVLWWPGRGKVRRALRFKRSSPLPRLMRDIHNVFGIYSLVVLTMLCVTGLVVVFPQQAQAVLGIFTDTSPAARATPSAPSGDDRPRLNDLARTVERAYPGSTTTLLIYPRTERGWYTFRIQPFNVNPMVRTTQVYLDRNSGDILGVFDPQTMPPGRSFIGLWSVYSHNGMLYGLLGRVFVLAAGLALTGLFGTGVYIWLKKRRRSPRTESLTVRSALR